VLRRGRLPFGYEKAAVNTCSQNYKFEGKERDPETNNDNFGARYYSNHFGRWLSPDWSAVPAPVPYANLTNPESFADLTGHNPNNTSHGPDLGNCLATNDTPQGACQAAAAAEFVHDETAETSNGQSDTASDQRANDDAEGHTGAFGLVRDWLDVIEVSVSEGFSASIGAQAGKFEGKAVAGVEVDATTGLGGGNKEVTVFGGAKASGQAGPAEGR